MKIVVYINKNDDSVDEVVQLNDQQYSNLTQDDTVERFNAKENNKRKAMMFDTDVDNIPKGIFNSMLLLLAGKKQVKLREIFGRLTDLGDDLDRIIHDFDKIKDKLEEVLSNE